MEDNTECSDYIKNTYNKIFKKKNNKHIKNPILWDSTEIQTSSR